MVYLISKRRLHQSEEVSLVASLLSILLFRHTALYGIDPFAIMVISTVIYFIRSRLIYSAIVLLSIGINEKIILLFAILGISRLLFGKNKSNVHVIVPSAALVLYLGIRYLVNAPGCEYQLDPSTYLSSLHFNILQTSSLKGLVLNILPTLIMVALYICALIANKQRSLSAKWYFQPADILPLVGLFIIAHMVRVEYNVGRITLYCLPLYLPLASSVLASKLSEN
ncbi:MAG: hypothetical protein GF315_02710 [candidate division Zixibacteria bacterium]|nr:hypothetical protein [candidate division Zixibacteria bacterium]